MSIWLYGGRRLREKSRSSHLYTTDVIGSSLLFLLVYRDNALVQGLEDQIWPDWWREVLWVYGVRGNPCESINLPISFICAPCSPSISPQATSHHRVLDFWSRLSSKLRQFMPSEESKWGIQVRNSWIASCEMCAISSTSSISNGSDMPQMGPCWKVFLTEPTKGWMRLQWQAQRQALCGCHATSSFRAASLKNWCSNSSWALKVHKKFLDLPRTRLQVVACSAANVNWNRHRAVQMHRAQLSIARIGSMALLNPNDNRNDISTWLYIQQEVTQGKMTMCFAWVEWTVHNMLNLFKRASQNYGYLNICSIWWGTIISWFG